MTDPREPLGRLVHDTRLACEAERAALEGRQRFNLEPWERRTYEQQETDMRIGVAVAAQALADTAPAPVTAAEVRRLEAAVTTGDMLVREILESLCRRDGLPLESSVVAGEPAA